MSPAADTQLQSFICLPFGSRTLALAAQSVIELVVPGELQKFPHQTPWLSGVIVRRGRVVPVCEVGKLLGDTSAPVGRFYLIVEWQAGNTRDWCAIPVAGECELATVESALLMEQKDGDRPPYVTALLRAGNQEIEIVNLGELFREQQLAFETARAESK